MVSLNEDRSRQGAYFFDQTSMSQDSEELIREESVLCEATGLPFRRIYTSWFIIAEILVLVFLEVAVFIVPHFCMGEVSVGCHCGLSAYSMLTYCQCGMWCLTLLFDQCYRYQHNVSRMHGYLNFYRKTAVLRKVPFLVFSGSNALLILLMSLLRNYSNCASLKSGCQDDHFLQCKDTIRLTGLVYLQTLVTVEVLISSIALMVYLARTVAFNREKPPPDVTHDDLFASFTQTQPPEIGFKDEDYMDEMMEKQADLIHYLKQHNQALGKKIVQLKAQLDARK